MQVETDTEYKATFRDERRVILGYSYDKRFTALIQHAEEMKAALLAANEAWDSGFSDKRHEARAKIEAALATVAP